MLPLIITEYIIGRLHTSCCRAQKYDILLWYKTVKKKY